MEIKELREKTGLSQAKFAKKYGLSVRTLQNWERGANKPPKTLIKLLNEKILNEEEAEAIKNGQLKMESRSEDQSESRNEDQTNSDLPCESKGAKILKDKKLTTKILSTVLQYLDDADLACCDCIYTNISKECKETAGCCIQLWKDYDKLIEIVKELTKGEDKFVDYVPF